MSSLQVRAVITLIRDGMTEVLYCHNSITAVFGGKKKKITAQDCGKKDKTHNPL